MSAAHGQEPALEWARLLKDFKEKLAKRLWSVPSLSETEKELLFKAYLSDLDAFETAVVDQSESADARRRSLIEENDLLRSLLGVGEDDLRARHVATEKDLAAAKADAALVADESKALRAKAAELEIENEELRKRIHEIEARMDEARADHLKQRENDIKYFSETHEALSGQLKDLDFRLKGLRELFADTNQKLVSEKQEEIGLLQKRLLDEMEAALKRRQDLAWAEEEMFAKGIAQKVRTVLVSAQGQLLLSLERLGLLDSSKKTEAFWKARLRLLIDGAPELAENFRRVQAQIQEVTQTLDDYLHLTRRREIAREPVHLKELVQAKIAEIYGDRRPTLSVEFLSDDPIPSIRGDAALLRFSIEALLENALEALSNGSGQIVVSIKNRSDEGRIELLVRDSGSGVPEHLQPKLFQPFFSTKERHQGLSLSRARRYIEMHAGLLELVQTGPQGTTFAIQLPLEGRRLFPGTPPDAKALSGPAADIVRRIA